MMNRADAICLNGEIVDAPAAADCRPFLYQYIRTAGHRALALDRHIAILDAASWQLRRTSAALDRRALESALAHLLDRNGYDRERSHILLLQCYDGGGYAASCCGSSLYDSFTLRALRPDAITVCAATQFDRYPTSAALARTFFLREYARAQGAAIAATADSNGRITTIDGAVPFVVIRNRIAVPALTGSVAAETVVRRIEEDGRKIEVRSITLADLAAADELFYADHHGITSVCSCDGRIYSDVIAHATAQNL